MSLPNSHTSEVTVQNTTQNRNDFISNYGEEKDNLLQIASPQKRISEQLPSDKLLGIDLGSVRIGLALSDELGWMAHPWQTLSRSPRSIEEIVLLAAEKRVSTIVVGLPRNLNGTYGPAAEQCRAFAQELQQKSQSKVVLWDERFTTAMATRQLREAGRTQKQQRSIIDQAAAQQILQDWMDAQQQNLV